MHRKIVLNMKKNLFFVVVLFVSTIVSAAGFEPFIKKNGSYVKFNENTDIVPGFVESETCKKGSFNYFRACLGYGNSEVITHFTDAFDVIAFNAFNNEIIMVIPSNSSKTSLTQNEVNLFLNGYKPSASDFASNLKSGVEDGSIRQSFVEESLGLTAENNTITDEVHGYVYTFENGILSNYKSLGGLSDDAVYVQEKFPQVYNKIRVNAITHYGQSKRTVSEYINGQCKYFMRINASYLRQAYNSSINYNFALLYSILYEGVSLDEFSFLVPGAEIKSSINNYVIMAYDTYIFTFKDNILTKE